jgi:chromosomal replication initiation ATPase DnaA
MGREDFIESPGNRAAATRVLAPSMWPDGRLALVGPAASGKTHLVHALMAGTGAVRVEALTLATDMVADLVTAPCIAVEDVDRMAGCAKAEAALFHLLNLAHAERVPLVVTGRSMPSRWPVVLPDLASRLSAIVPVHLEPPDDALLETLIAKLLADRHLRHEPGVPAFLTARIERSFSAAQAIVECLDTLSLAERQNITRKFAGRVLSALPKGIDEAP